mgnify:CR=1 FL=1
MAGTAPLLLLSMPQMADPNFARTVVLLCDYTDQGAFGLPLAGILSDWLGWHSVFWFGAVASVAEKIVDSRPLTSADRAQNVARACKDIDPGRMPDASG